MDPKFSNNKKKQQGSPYRDPSSNNTTTNLIIDEEQSIMQNEDQVVNSKKKWKCAQCTYENWPSAIKCTLCLNPVMHITFSSSSSSIAPSNPGFSKQNNKKKNLISSHDSLNPTNQCEITEPDLSSTEMSSLETNIEMQTNNESDDDYDDDQEEEASNKCPQESRENSIHNSSTSSPPSSSSDSSQNNNENIYDLYNIEKIKTNKSNSDNNNDVVTVSDECDLTLTKWSCSVCTYLNWPKSLKCVQCLTLKQSDSEMAMSTSTSTDACSNTMIQNATNLNNNNGEVNNLLISSGKKEIELATATKIELVNSPALTPTLNRSSCNSPCTMPKVVTQSIELISLQSNKNCDSENSNTNILIEESSASPKKWPCSACTYQNWPKAQRCIMCHIPRNNNITPSNLDNNNKKLINKQQQQQLQQMQAKLKNYQIQMDCLFLAACQGIVDADMTHLNMYVNSGGDLTRYLTTDECLMLNRPQIFTVGLTLLHLCYQFKRKEFLIKILNKSNNSNPKNNKIITNSPRTAGSIALNKTKFSPCQSCPTLASNIIDRYFSASLRQRKTQSYKLTENRASPAAELLGATNATLFNNNSSNYYYNHSSPTSSLISLNSNNCSTTNLNNNKDSNTKGALAHSPSPSPPPVPSIHGATSSSFYHHHPYTRNHTHSTGNNNLCFYVNESHTFTLPNEIEDFSPRIQHILYDELLDREVQQELENESRIINWNKDLCKRLNSKLYPLWNRHSGDCLLDSVLQACYGVFDTDNTLRKVMAESLEQYANCFKPRWKEHEILMAQSLEYKLDDYQLEQDWNNILTLANQPGASLEQAHIFALCHIFRRPIIVYSIKYVKSFRGENIGFTHFEGVYLPLIWEPNFCFKSPIALGYTRGHFTALVPLEKSEVITYMACNNSNNEFDIENDFENGGCTGGGGPSTSSNNKNNDQTILGAVSSSSSENNENQQTFYLPLTNNEGHLLPVHFLTSAELGRERSILKQYLNLDCIVIPGSNCGLLVAQQRVAKPGMLVTRMLEEWLSYYKNMQAKEYGRQIELSQEKEQIMTDDVQAQVQDDNQYEEEDDDEDEEVDSGDEDEDSPDDNESADEDYDEDDDYADEVEVQ